jgi:V/A-type H+-transporting ATPase subunit E
MSLDKVIESILNTGKKEAQQIIKQGQKERDEQVKGAQAEGQKLLDSKVEESKKHVETMHTQEIARSELESKKIILGSQKELLDSVYEAALQRLGNLPQNEAILRSLVTQNRGDISSGKVFCNEKDAAFVKGLVGGNFAGTTDCIGGLIIESQDGQMRIDLRYETALGEIWDDSIKDISDLLWSEE